MEQPRTIVTLPKKIGKGKISSSGLYQFIPSHNGVRPHITAFLVSLAFVAYLTTKEKQPQNKESMFRHNFDSVVNFLYLLAFATWVGIQVWVHVTGNVFLFALMVKVCKLECQICNSIARVSHV